jgi:H+/Cl- antiporter ClcA
MVALLVGALGGIAVMVAVNVPIYHLGNWPDQPREYFGFWGVLFGSFAAPFAFGIALAILRHEVVPRRVARRHPIAWSLIAAGVVGLAIMAAVNVPIYNSGQWPDHGREVLGFWGALFGLGASLTTFVVIRMKLGSEGGIDEDFSQIESSRKKVGLLISAIIAGLFGLLVTYWNAMWGTSLWSLEGAWLWPLAIVPLVVSLLLFRGYRRKSGSEKP